MARKCKAKLKTGPRKGKRCPLKPKVLSYCGKHKYLLLEDAKKATKVERMTMVSSLSVSLIMIAEKTSEHWPAIVEVAEWVGKVIGLSYPEPDPHKFTELMTQRRRLKSQKVLNDAKNVVVKGKGSSIKLHDLRKVMQATASSKEDRNEADQIWELMREIETTADPNYFK